MTDSTIVRDLVQWNAEYWIEKLAELEQDHRRLPDEAHREPTELPDPSAELGFLRKRLTEMNAYSERDDLQSETALRHLSERTVGTISVINSMLARFNVVSSTFQAVNPKVKVAVQTLLSNLKLVLNGVLSWLWNLLVTATTLKGWTLKGGLNAGVFGLASTSIELNFGK